MSALNVRQQLIHMYNHTCIHTLHAAPVIHAARNPHSTQHTTFDRSTHDTQRHTFATAPAAPKLSLLDRLKERAARKSQQKQDKVFTDMITTLSQIDDMNLGHYKQIQEVCNK